MKAIRPIVLVLCLLWVCACIPLPIPTDEVTSGREISEEEALFIESGVTTKPQVLESLGDPSVIWEDERVVAYNWDHVALRVLNVYGGGYTGGIFQYDVPTHYVLLIQFDEADRVKKFERTERSSIDSYGDFLREWVKEK